MKTLISFIFLGLSIHFYSQDTTNFYINSYHFEYSNLIRVNRNITLPNLVRDSPFYQEYFGEFGVPERIINKKHFGNLIGVKIGFRFDSYSKKNNHELILGVGYQNSGKYTDILKRNNTPNQYSTTSNINLARIEIENKHQELYLNGAWLFKTTGNRLSLHTGIGINTALSGSKYWVSEFEKGEKINTYQSRNGIKIYPSVYIPIGFEIMRDNEQDRGFIFGLDNTVRFDGDFFLGISISLGYKL